jgi:ClpP class serine protease
VEDWQDYADGRVLSGKQALNFGFVDELGDFDTARKRAESLAKISSANIVQYRMPWIWVRALSSFWQNRCAGHQSRFGRGTAEIGSGAVIFYRPDDGLALNGKEIQPRPPAKIRRRKP